MSRDFCFGCASFVVVSVYRLSEVVGVFMYIDFVLFLRILFF